MGPITDMDDVFTFCVNTDTTHLKGKMNHTPYIAYSNESDAVYVYHTRVMVNIHAA